MSAIQTVHIDSQYQSDGVLVPIQNTGVMPVPADADIKSLTTRSAAFQRVSAQYNKDKRDDDARLFYPVSGEPNANAIRRHEPVFYMPSSSTNHFGKRTATMLTGLGPSIHVRSALNGLTVEEAETCPFAGLWNGDYDHADSLANNTEGHAAGAVVMHGFQSTVNTGKDHLRPGDLITFGLPDICIKEIYGGATQLVPRVQITGIPWDKFTRVPKRVTLTDVSKAFCSFVETNLTHFRGEKISSASTAAAQIEEGLRDELAGYDWPEADRPMEYRVFMAHMIPIICGCRAVKYADSQQRGADIRGGKYDAPTIAKLPTATTTTAAAAAAAGAASGGDDAGSLNTSSMSGGASGSSGSSSSAPQRRQDGTRPFDATAVTLGAIKVLETNPDLQKIMARAFAAHALLQGFGSYHIRSAVGITSGRTAASQHTTVTGAANAIKELAKTNMGGAGTVERDKIQELFATVASACLMIRIASTFFTGPLSRVHGIVLNNAPVAQQIDLLLTNTFT